MFSRSTAAAAPELGRVYRSPLPAPPVDPPPVTRALRHAAEGPDRLAVVDGVTGERLTRGELAARSAALAAGLVERGVGPGDLVAVSLLNSASWPVTALGVWRAGAVLLPFSPLWTAHEAARVLARARPRIALADESQVPVVQRALAEASMQMEVTDPDGACLRERGGDPFAEPRLRPSDLAAVLFSSGTSGLPKSA